MRYSDRDIYYHREPFECPRCGKHSLVEKSTNHYRCLWCGFDRDLNDADAGEFAVFLFAILLILGLILRLILAP